VISEKALPIEGAHTAASEPDVRVLIHEDFDVDQIANGGIVENENLRRDHELCERFAKAYPLEHNDVCAIHADWSSARVRLEVIGWNQDLLALPNQAEVREQTEKAKHQRMRT
jgi:hypothetical protein